MANFIKLLSSHTKRHILVNMDLVEAFAWDIEQNNTVLDYPEINPEIAAPHRRVEETPDDIMEALIDARHNYGYGFGEAGDA